MNLELHKDRTSRLLLGSGVLLFLLGLLTGFIVPTLASPRLALSSHLEALMNGMFLVLLGLVWPRLQLARWSSSITAALALFGTYVNWGTTLLAAVWGAGEPLMPLAAHGHRGTSVQELVIKVGLVSLSLAMVLATILVLWGLLRMSSGRPRPA